jgi:hypothetical protein
MMPGIIISFVFSEQRRLVGEISASVRDCR